MKLLEDSGHTLARSLQDVSCANNNREAVVCFRLAFHGSGMRIFGEIFEFKIFWLPYFYHKDPYRIKFSRFYLLWGVKYQHICDFSHFRKCENYVITPSNV